jgi:hypothetical protein
MVLQTIPTCDHHPATRPALVIKHTDTAPCRAYRRAKAQTRRSGDMDLSERMMVERYELGNAQEDAALRNRGGLSLWLVTVALTATLVVLVVALGEALHGWDHLVVLGALVATAVGLMIAIAPNRRG